MPLYMKSLLFTTLGLLLTVASLAQPSFDTWEAESKTNKRLLPRYGHLPKTQEEIKSDSDYIKQIMALPEFKTRREASNHMIGLGFQYYYRPDFKTAMYRFNQAYLLDSTNTDIFWGYGAIYMAFGRYDLAKGQYDEGLSINSTNTHLLTDLATYYMEQFYLAIQMPKNDIIKDPKAQARQFMDSSIHYLNKSYNLDPRDVNTVYKLSICYWNIENCINAWKYYDEAVELGGRPITEEYTKDLKKRCKRKYEQRHVTFGLLLCWLKNKVSSSGSLSSFVRAEEYK
jgi:tetratricopeptide (TPR) repeat protein